MLARIVHHLLLALLLGSFLPTSASMPTAAARAQTHANSPEALPPQLPAVIDPRLPSLVLRLAVGPDPLTVGDTATISITVRNQAPDAASNVVVSLSVPHGTFVVPASPMPKAMTSTVTSTPALSPGETWQVGTLGAGASATITAQVHIPGRLPGDALVVTARATADGLDLPIQAVGGAIVDDPTAARATVNFVPSRAARLTSPDGRVTVHFPAGAAKQPLRLSYRSLPAARADVRTTPLVIPESRANNRRGFAPFFLTATNEQGNDVHQFDAPLTLTIRFTPQQLRALNLSAASLALYWFDETAPVTGTGDVVRYGDWVPLPTTIDAVAGTATAIVDHFSGYQLSDESSASSAYLPSLQTWQTSLFTGAASSSYPLEVSAAAGGMRPPLALTYSSSTTDGPEGMNPRRQGSWVGKGWSLDTGSIALNKVGRDGRYYAVAFGGQSFDLVRAEELVGSPDPKNPSHWAWRPTDENFVRVRVYDNGVSNSTRGGVVSDGDTTEWQRRYRWVIWTKDGTRYEFSEDLWWGFYACEPNNVDLSFETYKWLLSKVVDPSNN